MERIKVQTVSQRTDVNQRWSLIILSGRCSTSISFQFFTLNNEMFELMTKYPLDSMDCTRLYLKEVRNELKTSQIC